MNLHASQAEIDALEDVLRHAGPGSGLVAAKVALAWHLRQRDSGRSLRLVQDVMPVVRSPAQGDAVASCRARAALAAAEASALFGETAEAERSLADARGNLSPAWDPQAEGDAWLVEAVVARTRGQSDRLLAALRMAGRCFERIADRPRLEIARAWVEFERLVAHPESGLTLEARSATTEPDMARDAICAAARAFALSCRNPAAATRAFAHAGELARSRGLVMLQVTCQLETGALIHELGDYDRAARCFDAAAMLARATGWPLLVTACDTHLGALLCDLGAFEESQRTLEKTIEALSVRQRGPLLARAHAALARTLLAGRRTGEAVAHMDAAMGVLRTAGSPRELAAGLILQARVLAASLQPRRAAEVLSEAQALVESCGFESMRVALCQAQADVHHRFRLPRPPDMTLPSAALHFAEEALARGSRLTGWSARAALLDFLAERWAEAGDHERAYVHARSALTAKDRETAQKMSYPLALLRVRRHAEVRAGPDPDSPVNDPAANPGPSEPSGRDARPH